MILVPIALALTIKWRRLVIKAKRDHDFKALTKAKNIGYLMVTSWLVIYAGILYRLIR